MSELIKLKLISETPLFLGSYDAQSKDWDAFRTQSLKGLWRWWLRAYIMGVLYDLNLLRTVSGKNVLVELDRESINRIKKLTGKLLGSTESSSKFKISVTIDKIGRLQTCPNYYGAYCGTPRVRLLTLGGRRITYITSVEVTLSISERLSRVERLSRNEIILGIGSLLTALTLNGIGKMSRRGFGTFKVKLLNDKTGLFSRYFKRDGSLDSSKIPELMKTVQECCREYVLRELGVAVERRTSAIKELPPLDLISSSKVDVKDIIIDLSGLKLPSVVQSSYVPVFSIYEVTWSRKKITNVLSELMDFFYRPSRVKRYYGSPNTPFGHWHDLISVKRYSWFLGLPREQRGTGYMTMIGRRASPIHLAVHEDRAYITTFLSFDWPRTIEWIGAGITMITITKDLIVKTYVEVLAYLEDYLRKLNYSFRVMYP